jgi:hypothetical protein
VEQLYGKMLGFVPVHDVRKDVLDSKVASRFADGVEIRGGMGVNGVQNG